MGRPMSNRLVVKDSPIINGDQPGPDISRIAYCDRGYDRPSGRPRVSDPATYCSSTPRIQSPAVARWHTLLHGLATPMREISGLAKCCREQVVYSNPFWQQ